MDFSALHPDHFARQLAYTEHIYRDVYPAIDPSLPAHSQQGKVIIITGGGTGIGVGMARAFAQANARAIVLVGRRKEKLDEALGLIQKAYPNVEILTYAASVVEEVSLHGLFQAIKSRFGTADVLVNNAGVQPAAEAIISSDPSAWWETLNTNLRGTYLTTRAFLKQLVNSKRGTVINLSSGAGIVVLPGMSAYGLSKLAIMRFTECIAAEAENVMAVSLDPGTVNTDMQNTMPEGFSKFARDTPELAGAMAVWLSTEHSLFLNGRVVSSTWPVDELVSRKEEILAGSDLKVILQGKFGIES
ncbi:NAD(P)-binding protein [Polychaeton citri CBS 116435]|uniref:NAD(P)-binding protein n=1 Tax=Polychaeton citri CBS 116435 TaxID=1314669 RepID=A0A9P4Q155_9PEZI|nr:NAD(P)-binding protein [Polychaeton citri CBS 116435]